MIRMVKATSCLFIVLFVLAVGFSAAVTQPSTMRRGVMDLNSASTMYGTVYFSDDFEDGLGKWGLECTWDTTTSTSRSSSHSLTDSPEGNYLSSSDCSATLAHPIDLSGAVDPVLVFWHKGAIIDGDLGLVQVSTDGGTTWTQLAAYGNTAYGVVWNQSTWSLEQVDLQSYKSSSVKVRFRLASNGDSYEADGWYIDDVRIEEKDAVRLEYPFVDDFEAGLGDWIVSGWDWGLTDSTSRSVTHSLTDSPTGGYLPNSDCSATLAHPIDLSGAVDPVLVFWHKGAIIDGDLGLVEVSTDGGTTWTQ